MEKVHYAAQLKACRSMGLFRAIQAKKRKQFDEEQQAIKRAATLEAGRRL
jgi:vacuolar-type H+-ATPase subunit E/Vma4